MADDRPGIKAIFAEALEHPEGPDRDQYLAAACGDHNDLMNRVRALLAAYDRAAQVLGSDEAAPTGAEIPTLPDEATAAVQPPLALDRTSLGVTADAPKAVWRPAAADTDDGMEMRPLGHGNDIRYFGDYRIRRELGRGGMGVVYDATQVSLNRSVALKMVKAGLLAGDDELRRFKNEADAVAHLDHPGVVPIYEVGNHQGQYYFSMKLVPGGSLVALLPRYKDDPRAAARLAAETAEAVAHAHARGILHRDLKPANILVDDQGHSHITDFGLAKRLEADVELTASGAILGTPSYMAPEQASGVGGGITTATDVYGLGGVLYALLTGKPPFGGDSVGQTLDAVRHARPDPPARVNGEVPRDLETICLKCLEKTPRRRYPSAQALADDLRAWLDTRPISARRVGATERAWLWCRRRPAVAALCAAVLLASLIGTATAIAVQRQANRALMDRNAALTASLRREEQAREAVATANKRVEERYNLAVDAIKTFHTGVSEDFLLKQDQFKALRDRLLKSAGDFYGKLSSLLDKETDLKSRRALAQASFELAELTSDVGRKDESLAAHRVVLATREKLAAEPGADVATKAELGRSLTAIALLLESSGHAELAQKAYRRAESWLEGLEGGDTSVRSALANVRSHMSVFLGDIGNVAEALAIGQKARAEWQSLVADAVAPTDARRGLAETIQRIGWTLEKTGKPAAAEVAYRDALAILQKLAQERPANASFRYRLAQSHESMGWVLFQTGRTGEAETEYGKAIEIVARLSEESPAVSNFRSRLAAQHTQLGTLFKDSRRWKAAAVEYRKALAIVQRLVENNPASPAFRSTLADDHMGLGILFSQTGKFSEAETEHRAALGLYQRLTDENPADIDSSHRLALSHYCLSAAMRQAGKRTEAETHCRKALNRFQTLVEHNPRVLGFRRSLALCRHELAFLRRRAGDRSMAETEFRASLAIHLALVDENPTVADFRSGLVTGFTDLGSLLREAGNRASAEATYRQAIGVFRSLAERNPTIPEFRSALAQSHNELGRLSHAAGDLPAAEAEYRQSLAIRQELVNVSPTNTDFLADLAQSHNNLSAVLQSRGRLAEAEPERRVALAIRAKLAERHPDMPGYRYVEAISHLGLGLILAESGRGSAAKTEYCAVQRICRALAAKYPANIDYRDHLAQSHHLIGCVLMDQGALIEAEPEFRAALAIYEKLAGDQPAVAAYRDNVANTRNNLAVALRRLKWVTESLELCASAAEIREALIAQNAQESGYRAGLAENILNRGLARRALGDFAGAVVDVRHAIALFDSVPTRSQEIWFLTACAHAALAGLSGKSGSGVSATASSSQAEEAIGVLHKAASSGYRNIDAYQTADPLEPLRGREDFKLLMLDLAMPTVLFEPAR